MKLMVLAVAISSLIVLSGCGRQKSMSTEVSPNGAEAKLIAVVKGCQLYRIWDGREVYMAVCDGGAANTSWDDYNAATKTYDRHTVPTAVRQ